MEKAFQEAILRAIEEQTTNAHEIQQQLLEDILKENAETEYLNKYLNGQIDKQLFKKNVPIVTYEDIKHYIDRIVNGEPSSLFTGTSGGQPKMIPSTDQASETRCSIPLFTEAVLRKHMDCLEYKGKVTYFLFAKPELDTPSAPFGVITCLDTKQSMYCQLLASLLQRDEVLAVGAAFASALASIIKFLQDYWKEICSNIRTGHLSDWITEPACRDGMSSILTGPNPELADLLEHIFGNQSWEGILKKLWPVAKGVDVVVTGTMSQYFNLLDFYSGGLPIVSTSYTSSEACFGINLNPLNKPSEVSYTFLPALAYFEFLPVDKDNGSEKAQKLQVTGVSKEESAVDLVDVKVGRCYEVVVTTMGGLYRYRVGDILKVTGFYNNSPQFEFVERQNVVLSVDTDKTSESDLLKAIMDATRLLEPLGLLLTSYSSYADTSCAPGRYALFWELKLKESNTDDLPKLDPKIMEQCCARVEESLDFTYKFYRKINLIAPLEIRVVKQGAFVALMDFFVSRGASISQYKTPCCLKLQEAIEILNSKVVGKFFSSKNFS
ncbi:GH3 auxin-responsive promoter [Corchorus olitorius]|uniref:GH3 auxin-responsive promoter n=1 Tax=Corchorus olitorius TaxID=93759 RepID=A0A1R3HS89_9ROSI|nr:GH3 auxin-responsive promoter [Corchorus olitorius]